MEARSARSGEIGAFDLSPAPGGHRRIDRRDHPRLRIGNGQPCPPLQIGDEGGTKLGVRGDSDIVRAFQEEGEARLEGRVSLNERRLEAVAAALKASGASRVLDLGCGEGRLIQTLVKDRQFTEIVGVEVSTRTLERAAERLHLDRVPTRQKDRVRLMQGSLTYRDARLAGFDAAAQVEVVEHVDPGRLTALERVVFEFARPVTVVVTTPNVEYNVRFETLPAGKLRHADHRFEWTRAEFAAWANALASRRGYGVRFEPIGEVDPEVGAPTQMAVFKR